MIDYTNDRRASLFLEMALPRYEPTECLSIDFRTKCNKKVKKQGSVLIGLRTEQ